MKSWWVNDHLFHTVQPLLDPTRGNAACTFSPQCPGFPVYWREQIPLFLFMISLQPALKNPINPLYTGPPIHPTTKKLSAMACSLLLHLLPLPHPCSSTCGLGSSCQPGLCALSGSEVVKRFFLPGCLACLDEMVHTLKQHWNMLRWQRFYDQLYSLLICLISPPCPYMAKIHIHTKKHRRWKLRPL